MKIKMAIAFLSILLIVTLPSGCATGGKPTEDPSPSGPAGDEAMVIATSFYPMYVMALNVAGGIPGVEVVNMTVPTTGCLHDYAPTPDDMKNLERADCLVINGAGMESFMDRVLAQYPGLIVIEASAGIELIAGEGDEGDNPHVWVSVGNAITQVRTIGEGLAALDAGNAGAYRARADAYISKLEDLRGRMHAALDGLPHRDIVTFHEAFPYFAREFDLNVAGVIEREPGAEPSARELADTIDTIRALGAAALFAEPQYPSKAAETIAAETGSRVYTLDPAVTGPMDPDAYLDIMEENLKTLQEALK